MPNGSPEFTATLREVWRHYDAYQVSTFAWLARPWTVEALVLGGLLALGALRAGAWARRWLLLWSCCLAAAWWQGRGFRYHLLPPLLFAGAGLAGAGLTGVGLPRWLRVPALVVLAGLAGLAGLGLARHVLERGVDGGVEVASEFTGIPAPFAPVEQLGPGDAVLVLDTDMHTFFAWLRDHEVRWASRYACLWSLPSALRDEEAAAALRRTVLDDIRRYRPELVFVRGRELRFVPPGFDLPGFLGQDALRGLGYAATPWGEGGVLLRLAR